MRYDHRFRDRWSRWEPWHRAGYRDYFRRRLPVHRRADYGADYWWLGEREFQDRRYTPYDESYRRFSEAHHPRFTPVGGMYPAVGGFHAANRPRPLREPTWFSDWTRWF